jgi:hypothetical protein
MSNDELGLQCNMHNLTLLEKDFYYVNEGLGISEGEVNMVKLNWWEWSESLMFELLHTSSICRVNMKTPIVEARKVLLASR